MWGDNVDRHMEPRQHLVALIRPVASLFETGRIRDQSEATSTFTHKF
jgi:hypothetical protein